jgi:hypothetical protein
MREADGLCSDGELSANLTISLASAFLSLDEQVDSVA